jgi:hypothetical protein
MLTRRSAMKSALVTVAVPALPAATATAMGAPAIREAFDAYVDAYTTFFGVPYAQPEFATAEEKNGYYTERAESCGAWKNARRKLTRMVLEPNGFDPYGDSPSTVAAASVDLGDVIIVVAGDPDYEGSPGPRTGLYLVGRTPSMVARLAALPVWKDEADCDSYRNRHHYQRFLQPRPKLNYGENDVSVMADEDD